MRDLRKEFPVAKHHLYFDTASTGLLYESLMDWRNEHDLDFLLGGSTFRNGHKKLLDTVRKQVATFFGSKKENIALIPNFSFGFNALLEGVEKPKRVLLLENEYPSISWAVQSRDFEIAYAKLDENLEQNISAAFEKKTPDIFACSLVQYINGIKIDFEFLKQLKQKYPNTLLIADGTQYLGTEVFNFEESALDVLGASGYKWMLAGFGNGFLMVKEEVKNKIFPKTIGYNSAETMESSLEETIFIKHFEPGHQDTFNYGSLGFSLRFLTQIGKETIATHLEILCEKARQGFTKLNLLEDSVVLRKKHSTIFNIKGDEKLFQYLKANNIICSQRGNGIRLSFHFYNTEKEVGSLVALLQNYLSR